MNMGNYTMSCFNLPFNSHFIHTFTHSLPLHHHSRAQHYEQMRQMGCGEYSEAVDEKEILKLVGFSFTLQNLCKNTHIASSLDYIAAKGSSPLLSQGIQEMQDYRLSSPGIALKMVDSPIYTSQSIEIGPGLH